LACAKYTKPASAELFHNFHLIVEMEVEKGPNGVPLALSCNEAKYRCGGSRTAVSLETI
jgi:hypothetical protein